MLRNYKKLNRLLRDNTITTKMNNFYELLFDEEVLRQYIQVYKTHKDAKEAILLIYFSPHYSPYLTFLGNYYIHDKTFTTWCAGREYCSERIKYSVNRKFVGSEKDSFNTIDLKEKSIYRVPNKHKHKGDLTDYYFITLEYFVNFILRIKIDTMLYNFFVPVDGDHLIRNIIGDFLLDLYVIDMPKQKIVTLSQSPKTQEFPPETRRNKRCECAPYYLEYQKDGEYQECKGILYSIADPNGNLIWITEDNHNPRENGYDSDTGIWYHSKGHDPDGYDPVSGIWYHSFNGEVCLCNHCRKQSDLKREGKPKLPNPKYHEYVR